MTHVIESGMSLLTISKLVGTSIRYLEKTYAHALYESRTLKTSKAFKE